nr:hypothetical protein CFP56_20398 [Quercus suber]
MDRPNYEKIHSHTRFCQAFTLWSAGKEVDSNYDEAAVLAYLATGNLCLAVKYHRTWSNWFVSAPGLTWVYVALYGAMNAFLLMGHPSNDILADAMEYAAVGNNVDMMKLLVSRQTPFGSAAMTVATFGSLEVLQFLHQQGVNLKEPDPENGDRYGDSPLRLATINRHAHVVFFFIKIGAHPSLGFGLSAYRAALCRKYLDILALFVRHCPGLVVVEQRRCDGQTVLDLALAENDQVLLELLRRWACAAPSPQHVDCAVARHSSLEATRLQCSERDRLGDIGRQHKPARSASSASNMTPPRVFRADSEYLVPLETSCPVCKRATPRIRPNAV